VFYEASMGQNKQAPAAEKRTVARKREYLTEAECEKLLQAARGNRYGHRDYAMLLAVWRHGLRASEACDLEWADIDFGRAEMHIRRAKLGKPAVHPIRGDELRALRRLQREQDPKSTFAFTTERGGPMTPDALNRMVKRLGNGSKRFGFSVHVHMLRHACGYKLTNDGHDTRLIQDYLGHKSIMSTVRYTELSATKFKNVWR
jgi:integrase